MISNVLAACFFVLFVATLALLVRLKRQHDAETEIFKRFRGEDKELLQATKDEFASIAQADEAHMETLRDEVATLRGNAATLERRAMEYFGVIEDIEKERNRWQELWREQTTRGQVGQIRLEEALGRMAIVSKRLLLHVNELRTEKGLDPLRDHIDVSKLPFGAASELEKFVELQIEKLPKKRDYMAIRQALKAAHDRTEDKAA